MWSDLRRQQQWCPARGSWGIDSLQFTCRKVCRTALNLSRVRVGTKNKSAPHGCAFCPGKVQKQSTALATLRLLFPKT